jgi:Rrf2 family protein
MFRISRRLDYGLQLMVALAAETDNRAQSTASLAQKLQIPLPFLHQIGHTLMQAGVIKATPGPRGGLRLNQPADSITVLDIVETLEGKVDVNPQTDDETPAGPNQVVWSGLQATIVQQLSTITLSQLNQIYQKVPLFSVPVTETSNKLN